MFTQNARSVRQLLKLSRLYRCLGRTLKTRGGLVIRRVTFIIIKIVTMMMKTIKIIIMITVGRIARVWRPPTRITQSIKLTVHFQSLLIRDSNTPIRLLSYNMSFYIIIRLTSMNRVSSLLLLGIENNKNKASSWATSINNREMHNLNSPSTNKWQYSTSDRRYICP